MKIAGEGDKLIGQPSGQGKQVLEAVSETHFIVPAVKANVTFEKNAEGKVIGLVLVQGARTTKAKKIK